MICGLEGVFWAHEKNDKIVSLTCRAHVCILCVYEDISWVNYLCLKAKNQHWTSIYLLSDEDTLTKVFRGKFLLAC